MKTDTPISLIVNKKEESDVVSKEWHNYWKVFANKDRYLQLRIGTDIFGCCKVKKYKHKNYIRLNMDQML